MWQVMVVKLNTDDWDQFISFDLSDNWEPIGVTHLHNREIGLIMKREVKAPKIKSKRRKKQ